MEWFNILLDSLTTDFCVLKYGGVEQCRQALTWILLGLPAMIVVTIIVGIVKKRDSK